MDEVQRYGLLQDSEDGQPVPLQKSNVHVTIQGFVANVDSELTYYNATSEAISTTFVFPVDDASAVYKFEAAIDQKRIVAECQDKTQAQETYQAAVSQGLTAVYLAEDDLSGDVFECKLGNLPPRETAVLTFCYVTELSPQVNGSLKFTLPMVLNPRYSPMHMVDRTEEIKDGHQKVSSASNHQFSAAVCGHHKVKAITGDHELDVSISDDKLSSTVKLGEEPKDGKDLSFDVEYENISEPEVILEYGSPEKEGLLKEDVLMLNICPKLPSLTSEDKRREFIFVIDRSGSMGGIRIKKAKETLLLLLKSLPVDCLFNIVSYGSRYSMLFDMSKIYSDSSLDEALKLQKSMNADMGGTEILDPLKKVYSQKCNPNYPRQIFLLTDGEVSNTNEVIALAKKNCNNTRVFTFGIGDGCSTSLIKNVAEVSGGESVFIKDSDNMKAKVISIMKSSFNGVLRDIKIEYSLPEGISAQPIAEPGYINDGKSLTLFTMIKTKGEKRAITGRVIMKGTYKDEEHSFNVDIMGRDSQDEELPLHRLAAKHLIDQLENEELANEVLLIKDKIVLASLAANVVSRHTAFVGFDKESREAVSVLTEDRYKGLQVQYCLAASGLYCDMGSMNLMGATSYKRKKSGFPLIFRALICICCFPCVGCYYCAKCCKERRSKNQKQKKSTKSLNVNQDDEDSLRIEENEESGTLMEIVSLQNFDGSWSPTAKLSKVLSIPVNTLSDNALHVKADVWCTAVVVAYLEEKFPADRTEWEMITDKAVSWLESQDKDGKEVSEILQQVKQLF